MERSSERILIVGGGIHGVATAYYLSCRGIACTVIERVGLASAASGKAGGFLARDWGNGPTGKIALRTIFMGAI